MAIKRLWVQNKRSQTSFEEKWYIWKSLEIVQRIQFFKRFPILLHWREYQRQSSQPCEIAISQKWIKVNIIEDGNEKSNQQFFLLNWSPIDAIRKCCCQLLLIPRFAVSDMTQQYSIFCWFTRNVCWQAIRSWGS